VPHEEFLAELDLLYRAAGRPSYRRISTEIRKNNHLPDTVSHETVSAILRGEALARWTKVESVVRQLAATAVHRPNVDEEVRRFHALWSAAVDSQQTVRPIAPRYATVAEKAPDAPPLRVPPVAPPADAVTAVTTPIGLAPQRNPGFTGRRELLDLIASTLDAQPWKPLVLYGLGGVGKTQLAAEFLYRNAHHYEFVGWITAEDPTQATAALASLGERQDWPARFDMAQTVRTVLTKLESGAVRWLIVYDNARGPHEIKPLLPQAGGDLIVTTRDAAWLNLGRPVEVDVFARPESVELLSARCHEITFDEADQLAERLGDLPLALDQVAAMQSVTRTPIRDYLQQFDERALEFLGSAPPGDYRTTIATGFTVAAERVRRESLATAQLLELICCLGAEPISLTLLRTGGRQIAPPLGRLLDQPDALDEAIWRLRRYGLVKVVDDGQSVQVHRLMQAIVRDAMPTAERQAAYINACRMLAAANPGRPTDPLTWDMHMRIGPHLRPARMVEVIEPDVRQALIDQAVYLYQVGDFEGSRRLSEDALSAWDRHGVTDDVQVAFCLRRLVAALYEIGRYDEAFERADERYTRLFSHPDYGPEHPATLALADSLAVMYRGSGEYGKALALNRDIVDGHRSTRDWNAGTTLDARNNLAASLRTTGDFQAAHEIDAELVEVCRTKYGPDHQRTLLAVSNLARDLYGLGQYTAALELQRSTWNAYRDRLGDRHPLVLAAWRTIALGLRKTGQTDAARDESRQLHLTCRTHLGVENRMTLAAMMTYANTLCVAGEVYRAVQLAGDAVDRHRRTYGDRNPFTLVAATNQAIILRAIGERRRARSVGEASFHALRQRLGADHPYTIAAAIGVCNDLVLAREEESARRLLAGTLDDARRVFGEFHPDALICAINLGLLIGGEPSGEGSLLGRSINALRRALGTDHPVVTAAVTGQLGECDVEPPPV
jgi:tetratricopeptide (TPR) repeat protein